MKLLFRIILFILLWSTALFSQSGWIPQNSGTSLTLRGIHFVNENTGYIVGGNSPSGPGIIRKSSDGGSTWFTQYTMPSNYLNAIYFINANTGSVVGSLGATPTILRTINGGTNWFLQTSPPGVFQLYGVFLVDENVGVIVGGTGPNLNGTILYTSNGGNTWLDRSYFHDGIYYDTYFLNANTGIVVGLMPGIIRTTNAGINWNSVDFGSANAVSFVDPNTGICVQGAFSENYKTTNSGINWYVIPDGTSSVLYDISCIDIITATSVGTVGTVLRTTNGGSNWLQQSSGTSSVLRSVSFVNTNKGWVCGDNGTILKTTTGGITAINPISNEIPNQFKLYQNYPNPFNPNTKIKFEIPKAGLTTLKIYDALGSEAAAIVDEELKPGTYQAEWDASNLPSGVYFYKITSGEYTETKKMVVLK